MAQVTQKRFFEIQPLNNVTEFTPSAGQDTIRFVIPPINLAYLDELVVQGNLQVTLGATPVAYISNSISGDAQTKDFSHDNVAGIHSYIDRVEINSRRGNINIA